MLLSGSEAWTGNERMTNRMDRIYTKFLHRIFHIGWRDHVSNQELYSNIPTISFLSGEEDSDF